MPRRRRWWGLLTFRLVLDPRVSWKTSLGTATIPYSRRAVTPSSVGNLTTKIINPKWMFILVIYQRPYYQYKPQCKCRPIYCGTMLEIFTPAILCKKFIFSFLEMSTTIDPWVSDKYLVKIPGGKFTDPLKFTKRLLSYVRPLLPAVLLPTW